MSKMFAWLGVWIVLFVSAMGFTASPALAVYVDAININIGAGGAVSGTQGTPYYAAASWNNFNNGSANSVNGIVFTNVGLTAYGNGSTTTVDGDGGGGASGTTAATGFAIYNDNNNDARYADFTKLTISNSSTFAANGYDVAVQMYEPFDGNPSWVLFDNGGSHYTEASAWTGSLLNLANNGRYNLTVDAVQYLAVGASVPEPSTFVLAGLGLAGLSLGALRKKFRRVALS